MNTIYLTTCNLNSITVEVTQTAILQLNVTDKSRYKQFLSPTRQLQFLSGRILLAQAASMASNSDISLSEIYTYPNGKPYIEKFPEIFLAGISHSRQRIFAVCGKTDVLGFDTEFMDKKRPLTKITKHQFGPTVACQLNRLEKREQINLFYRLWTGYEARYKAGVTNEKMYKEYYWMSQEMMCCLVTSQAVRIIEKEVRF